MNILHILDVNHLGNGITSVVMELSKSQRHQKHNVRVLNLRPNAMDIPGFKKCLNRLELQQELTEFMPEIVIFHGVFYKQIRNYSHLLRSRNIPYLIELHGAYSLENYRKNKIKKMLFWHLCLKDALSHSKGIIFLNENEKRNFALDISKVPCYIVPNGCSENSDFRLSKIKEDESISFLYLGRIDINHKGLDILIDAIRELSKNQELNNIHFKFFGPGLDPDLSTFKKLTADIPMNVTYYGPIYGQEKEFALRDADIFILTSRYEGFPMSILEALSYGCPCLVSKGTNVADIIKEFGAGWVVETLSSSEVADMIRTAIKYYTVKSEQLRHNAITASKEYLWDRIATKSIDVYSRVLKEK